MLTSTIVATGPVARKIARSLHTTQPESSPFYFLFNRRVQSDATHQALSCSGFHASQLSEKVIFHQVTP